MPTAQPSVRDAWIDLVYEHLRAKGLQQRACWHRVFPTPTPRRIPASKQRRDHRERRATRAVAVVGGDHALTVYAPERSRASFSL